MLRGEEGDIRDVCKGWWEEGKKLRGPSSLPDNQGSSLQSSHRNRGSRSHSRKTQRAGVREGAVGIVGRGKGKRVRRGRGGDGAGVWKWGRSWG